MCITRCNWRAAAPGRGSYPPWRPPRARRPALGHAGGFNLLAQSHTVSHSISGFRTLYLCPPVKLCPGTRALPWHIVLAQPTRSIPPFRKLQRRQCNCPVRTYSHPTLHNHPHTSLAHWLQVAPRRLLSPADAARAPAAAPTPAYGTYPAVPVAPPPAYPDTLFPPSPSPAPAYGTYGPSMQPPPAAPVYGGPYGGYGSPVSPPPAMNPEYGHPVSPPPAAYGAYAQPPPPTAYGIYTQQPPAPAYGPYGRQPSAPAYGN